MKNKIVSIVLIGLILLTNTIVIAKEPYNPIVDVKTFDDAQALFKDLESPFLTRDDVDRYFNTYWSGFFPFVNDNDIPLNYESILKNGLIVYGDHTNTEGNKQSKGEWLLLGQNVSGGYVTNLAHPEATMLNPKIITGEENIKSDSGVKKRFSKWNSPDEVANLLGYDGIDSEEYGRKVLEVWAKNIKNRLGYFHGGQDFINFMSVDDILQSFVIQIPPTARTYGLATAWFRSANGTIINHRTFIIDKVPRLDLVAVSFEYIDTSKTVRIGYKMNGIEQIDGDMDITLRISSKEIENKPIFNKSDEVIVFSGGTTTNVLHIKLKDFTRDILNKDTRYLDLDLSYYLKDFREEEIEVTAYVNYLGLIREDDYTNNSIKGIIPPNNTLDFSIDTYNTVSVVNEGEDIEVKLLTYLDNSQRNQTTTVTLYNEDGKKVTETNVIVPFSDTKIVNLNINKNELKIGNNTFYAVINSNFNLTSATPVTVEKILNNNKTEININVIQKLPNISNSCAFRKDGDTRVFQNKVRESCLIRSEKTGRCLEYNYSYPKYNISLKQSATLNYIQDESQLRSNSWSNDKLGQLFKPHMPIAKDLSGKNAEDELMKLIGINPLKQIIRTGHGMQVSGKIKIIGTTQAFDNYDHSKIEDFINFIEKNMYVVGYNVRNNNGEYSQKLEVDKNRSSEYKKIIKDTTIETYGNYVTQKVYTTDFEVEIPVIITKATGTIDVIQGKKVSVPNENKWFVYLNEPDGEYKLNLRVDINQNKLGVIGGDTTQCVENPDNFKFSVYGTIFDTINTELDNPSKPPKWDN